MPSDKRDHLISWLRDAHMMENHAIEMLERQVGRLDDYPAFKERVAQHLRESRGQLDRLNECLEALGAGNSTIKSGLGALGGNLQALMNTVATDEVVKGALMSYAFEHFEIASYRILIAAAEDCSEARIAQVCRETLKEEEAMQQWLLDHLDDITKQFLARQERVAA
jgi:ferritin-like metal-binding protein YciE